MKFTRKWDRMKKWKIDDKPDSIFCTSHQGVGGGDLYAHQLAKELDLITEMRYIGNGISREFRSFYNFDYRFKHTGFLNEPSIFMGCSHFEIMSPIAKHRNILVTFFPNKKHKDLVKGYDTIITCSQFSARWVKKYWGKNAVVIYPYINPDDFKTQDNPDTRNKILSVGRFFQEASGHSKQQHVLISAFKEILRSNQNFKLTLCGSVLGESDRKYIGKLKNLAKGLPVEFVENASASEKSALYSSHAHYWHANGLNSKDPYETEHFGIVFAEALMSGCYIYPCKNGGWQDFGSFSNAWRTESELVKNTLNNLEDGYSHIDKARMFACEKFSEKSMRDKFSNILIK